MKAQRMTPDIACKYLTTLLIGKYRYVNFVTFFGGEPTLCPETIEAICKFFDKNVELGLLEKMPIFLIISNGTLIDENMANLIHKYEMHVTISVDGPQEINDLLRVDVAGKGTFLNISKGIDNLNKVGAIPTIIEATYTSKHKEMGYTKEDIQDYYVLLKFEKIDKLKNHHCTDCWAKAVCLSCPATLLLEKSLEKLDAECYTRRILEKHMILKCAKFSLAKNS